MSRVNTTTDHREIQRWVESRNGHPAYVRSTRSGGGGLLRIDFDRPEPSLDQISWDEFFKTFDDSDLAFIYQEKTASGRRSRFNKFIKRSSAEETGEQPDEGGDEEMNSERSSEEEDER